MIAPSGVVEVDRLGQLLSLLVRPANGQDRAQVAELAKQVQEATGEMVEVALVDRATLPKRRAMRSTHRGSPRVQHGGEPAAWARALVVRAARCRAVRLLDRDKG
jgi:hypothetical protein